MSPAPLLSVEELRTYFRTTAGVARAVDGVSFSIAPNESVGVVGESGCGKSVTSLSLLRLIQRPGAIEPGSKIEFEGTDLLSLDDESMRRIRGNRIAMIFQEPMTALNPVFTVGAQLAEVPRVHQSISRSDAWARAIEMLGTVGIPDPAERAHAYPHQLSGGMRQRVMIGMALMLSPSLLIADEPTTALDVTIQAQILELLAELRARTAMSVLLITHDLGVVAESTSRVIVMYAGEIVEQAGVRELFARPHHPYTEGLMAAMPRAGTKRERLAVIPGAVRSPYAWERCARAHPPLYEIGAGHVSRCHLAVEPERRTTPHISLAARARAGT